uniref:Uncharacterized protein n=1 Tax=Solanum lycopersicum TaxID=4081 RepID=K4C0W8_SOLLC
MARGQIGVYHGAMSYLLQDEEGQIIIPHSISVGLFHFCVAAYKRLCRQEGIIPSLEASHAIAFLDKLCYTLKDGEKVTINLSGHGEKDAAFVFDHTPNHE